MNETWDIQISTTYPVTVPVFLNGNGPYTFLLDTGCVRGNLSQPVAEALSLGLDDLGCAVLDTYAIGDLLVPGYHIFVRDNAACRADVGPGRQLDGFLGMDFLRYYRTSLDYPGGRLGLVSAMDSMPRTMYKPEPGFSYVRIKYANLYVILPVQVNGSGPHYFVLDTGAQRTLVSPELADHLGLVRGESRDSWGIHGPAGSQRVCLSEVASLQVGAQGVEHLPIAIADCTRVSNAAEMQIDGYIGHNFLSHFTIRLSVLELAIGFGATEPCVSTDLLETLPP